MNPLNLPPPDQEEQLFLRRLSDMHDICARKHVPKFSAFLNERQQIIAEGFARRNHIDNYAMFGGYGKAVRKLCGFFPVYDSPDPEAFPIVGLCVKYHRGAVLTHRDFLGSLMAIGIKRESIGDILPVDAEGKCALYALDGVSQAIMRDLQKVGNIGVKCELQDGEPDIPEQSFENIRGTVGSARLDSIVKLATGFSREKSAGLIRAGAVQHNYIEQSSVSTHFSIGDIISIRGFGKIRIDGIGDANRKGRLPVTVSKYK